MNVLSTDTCDAFLCVWDSHKYMDGERPSVIMRTTTHWQMKTEGALVSRAALAETLTETLQAGGG